MGESLDRTQRRIIGTLIEKQLATPDQYPLTLNALQLGCNQKSSREPIMSLEIFEIEGTLRSLQLEGWILQRSREGGRAVRWGHRADEKLGLAKPELALMSVLMLRGPQTLNELKSRTERLHAFTGHDAVLATLNQLAARPSPLVRELPRRAGERAERWEHRLVPSTEEPEVLPPVTPRRSDDEPTPVAAPTISASKPTPSEARPPTAQPEWILRIESLESEVDALKEELRDLRNRLDNAGA